MLKKLSILMLLSAPLVLAHGREDFDPYYIHSEIGGSFAMKPCITADSSYWAEPKEGYNSCLGNAFMAGVGAGFNLNCWFSLGLAANYRGPFHYKFHQTTVQVPVNAVDVPGTRYFNYENSSVMFNLFFNRTGASWGYRCGGFTMSPYLNLGVGFGRNAISNFHTVKDVDLTTINGFTPHQVIDTMQPIAQTSTAWQAALGLDFTFCDAWTLGFAYRYFDAGKFCSNDYLSNDIVDFNNETYRVTAPLTTVPAWNLKFQANEFVFTLKMDF